MLCSDLTKPMFEISLFLNPSLEAATSNIRRFSLVLEPRDIMSNKDFEWVKRSKLTLRLRSTASSLQSVVAVSNRSAKAITSAAIADLHSLLAL